MSDSAGVHLSEIGTWDESDIDQLLIDANGQIVEHPDGSSTIMDENGDVLIWIWSTAIRHRVMKPRSEGMTTMIERRIRQAGE